MYWKIFINLVVVFIVFVLQKSLIPFLPLGIGYINLVIAILIIILMVFGAKSSLPLFISLGWLLDVFRFSMAGINILSLMVIFLISYILLKNFIADKSLYALMLLTGIATFLNDLIVNLGELGNFTWPELIEIYGKSFWLMEWKRVLANLILTWILFYLSSKLTKRIQPVFLRELKRY